MHLLGKVNCFDHVPHNIVYALDILEAGCISIKNCCSVMAVVAVAVYVPSIVLPTPAI